MMKPATYTYNFPDFSDAPNYVHFTEHHTGHTRGLHVALDDAQFGSVLSRQLPTLYADLIDLAIAVHIADRFSIGRADLPRRIYVELPLRHPDMFDKAPVLKQLQETLCWYTADQWDFAFVPRTSRGRVSELQCCLPLDEEESGMPEVE